MEVPTLTIFCREGHPPADDIFAYSRLPAASTFSISSPRSRTRGRGAGAGMRWPGCSPSGSRR